jgi:diguanylate cyclase (GGDEF)-like protein
MDRVILVMQDNQMVGPVREQLYKHYQVLEAELTQTLDFTFDLGIVDEASLQQKWQEVQSRKEASKPIFLPFLLVTTQANTDFVTRHLWQTVDEIIWSPINHLELQTRVENLLRSRRLSLETQRLTHTDLLTGIQNRRHFYALGEREINRARRFQRSLSVVMVELDRFQRIYDQYGYEVGNRVVRVVAQHFQKSLRTIDVLGRYGEEKFVILLTDTDMRGAEKVVDRLRQEISETQLHTELGPIIPTISLGISGASGDMPLLEALVERADNALCAAKQVGGNCVRIERFSDEGIDFVGPEPD